MIEEFIVSRSIHCIRSLIFNICRLKGLTYSSVSMVFQESLEEGIHSFPCSVDGSWICTPDGVVLFILTHNSKRHGLISGSDGLATSLDRCCDSYSREKSATGEDKGEIPVECDLRSDS